MVSINPGNNAFLGGAQQRNLAPPTVGGGLAPASTGVGAPVGGVNPGQIKSARNNEGSNIGIPYTRLCPLTNQPPQSKRSLDGDVKVSARGETETGSLRATSLAFILGKRSKVGLDRDFGDRAQFQMPRTTMPGMPGTERFQQLCSFEYLKLYFQNVLAPSQIKLNEKFSEDKLKDFKPANSKIKIDAGDNPDTLASVDDYAIQDAMAQEDSEIKKTGKMYQGIFARDFTPFLRGKGVKQALMATTVNNVRSAKTEDEIKKSPNSAKDWQPSHISRNLGDETAFAALGKLLMDSGLMDWTPDGVVLSKGTDDPNDEQGDAYMNARDGQLFNMRIQGPAIATTWTGDSSMETLPLDKVFVVMVVDVWFDLDGDDEKAVDNYKDGKGEDAKKDADGKVITPARDAYQAYSAYRRTQFQDNAVDTPETIAAFGQAGYDSLKKKGAEAENTVLTNFRLELATSSQMVNYSHHKAGGASSTVYGKRSRMGLHLASNVGEYIVGGWCIGNVMDTAASRGSFPSEASSIGVRTAPNSAALSINVNIDWWDGDRIWRTFANKENKTSTRFEPPKGPPKRAINRTGEIEIVEKAAAEEKAEAEAKAAKAAEAAKAKANANA